MTLTRLTLKSIADKKVRFALTTLAVVFGVAFTVAVFMTTDSLRSTFGDLADDIAGQVDLTARAEQEFGDDLDRALIDPALADQIATVDGVAAVDGGVQTFNVRVIGDDGEPIGQLTNGPPQVGLNWGDVPELNVVFPAEGRQPAASDEFAINATTLDDEDLVIGNTYTVQVPAGNQEMTLVGTFNFADPDSDQSAGGAQLVAFDTDTAADLFYDGAGWNWISIDVDDGADQLVVASSINEILPSGFEVVTNEVVAAEQEADFDEFIDIIQNILLAFAVVILVVSAFIIYNTFSIVIGQRVREFGLLRAVGASGRQISQSVIGESFVVGLVSTGLGLAGGVGMAFALRGILNAVGFDLPEGPIVLNSATVIAAVVIGVGVTMGSAIFPALKARRVSPMAALRDDIRIGSATVAHHPVLGSILLGLGVLVVIAGVVGSSWQLLLLTSIVGTILIYSGGSRLNPVLGRMLVLAFGGVLLLLAAVASFGTTKLLVALAVGALVVFVGVNLVSPMFAKPVARFIGAPLPRAFGISGRLSRQNAARSPRRTASTASALMIGLALVGTVSVIGASLKTSFTNVLDRSVTADWFICVGGCTDPTAGFSQQFANDVEALDELDSVVRYRFREEGFREVTTGEVEDVVTADFAVLDEHLDLDITSGDPATAGPDGILVHTDDAEDFGLVVGDTIDVEFTTGETNTFTVAAIYDDDRVLSGWVISNDAWDRFFVSDLDQFVSAVNAPGVTEEQARAALTTAGDDFPEVELRTKDEFRDDQAEQIDQFLLVVNVFLGLAVIIALLGIINTLVLSIYERTRELGLLRAVGMNRRQMRRMIRWEGVIVAVFGGLLGALLGVLFGAITTIVIPDSFIDTLSVPVGQLVVFVIVAGIAGVIAAVYPARKAAKLDVLEAIAHE